MIVATGGTPPQSASPVVGLIPAQAGPTQKVGNAVQFPFHRTGNGVTVVGGALKVPVATNCTGRLRSLTVAIVGLTEIDTSVRLGPIPHPKVAANKERSVAEHPTRIGCIRRLQKTGPTTYPKVWQMCQSSQC